MVFFRWIWVGFRQEVSGNAEILENNCFCQWKTSKGHQEFRSKRRVNRSQRGLPARAAIGTSMGPFTHALNDKMLQTMLSSFARLISLHSALHSVHQRPRAGLCCLDLHAAKSEQQWMSSAKWLVVFQHRRPGSSFALPMILISHLWCLAGRGLAQPAEQKGAARGWCPKHSLLGWCWSLSIAAGSWNVAVEQPREGWNPLPRASYAEAENIRAVGENPWWDRGSQHIRFQKGFWQSAAAVCQPLRCPAAGWRMSVSADHDPVLTKSQQGALWTVWCCIRPWGSRDAPAAYETQDNPFILLLECDLPFGVKMNYEAGLWYFKKAALRLASFLVNSKEICKIKSVKLNKCFVIARLFYIMIYIMICCVDESEKWKIAVNVWNFEVQLCNWGQRGS